MRRLPPVDAPFRLIFRGRRPDRNWKFTKLLYRLSYVGACFLIIFPLSEGVSGGRENSRPATSRSILAVSPTTSPAKSNESPGVRRSRLVVRAKEFRPLLGRRPIRGSR